VWPRRLGPGHPWLEPLRQGQTLRQDLEPGYGLALPVGLEGRLWGFVLLRGARASGWGEEETVPLRWAAHALVEALQRSRLEQALRQSEQRYAGLQAASQRRVAELSLLSSVLRALATDLEPEPVFRKVVEAVSESLGGSLASLYLLEGKDLILQHQVGYHRWFERIPLERGVIGRAVRNAQAQLITDPAADPDFLDAVGGVVSAIAIPVCIAEEVGGVLAVESRTEVFTPADLERLQSVAAPLGLVLERARLFRSLRESESRFRALVETSPDGILQVSAEGVILYANPRYLELLGAPGAAAVVGQPVVEFVAPEFRQQVAERIRQVTAHKQRVPFAEQQYRRFDGTLLTVEVSASPVEDPRLGQTTLIAIVRDITARKQTEQALRQSEQRYRLLAENVTDAIFILDLELNFSYVSPSVYRLNGYEAAELQGRNLYDVLSPHNAARVGEVVRQQLGQTHGPADPWASHVLELTLTHKNGQPVWSEIQISFLRDEQGQAVGVLAVARNISERRLAETAMRESETRYRSLFEGMPIGLYRTSLDGYFLDGNPALVQMLGFDSLEELRQHNAGSFYCAPQTRPALIEQYLHGGVHITETELVRRDGRRLWVQEVAHLVCDEQGKPLYFEGSLQDISERKAYQAQVERLAYYDPLTALPNRFLLQERAEQALARARRSQQAVTLAYLDLDRFKEINDTLGHKVGDELLRLVADRIRNLSREADTQARLGGDEFALLLCDTDSRGASQVASRLLEALKQPFVVGGETVHVGASIGLAVYPRDGETLDALTRAADIAMYQAKAEGGGFRFYNPAQNRYTRQRLSTLQGLRRALGQGELLLHYQPVLDLRTQTLRRMEALVRWQDPERGMIPPSEFVPLAEETGIIQELDLFVLEQALREAQSHGLEFSLNLSARNFHDPHFVELAAHLLQQHPLGRGRLWLEITETALMLEREKAIHNLQALRNLGARIALDDFGMGYSSLAYLKHLPVDMLKLDKQFVAGIGNARDEAILHSVIALGHGLGLEVLAEGVETPRQLAWLQSAGCDLAQGYYIGMPSPSGSGGFAFQVPLGPES
ncbi:EAL domain-containing protein, partial [Calidithermus terrae]|uniref:EAL domain-containing protein n=1 Tax=Calidithermus terrae TaxID=1408545 RepID=UPI000E64A3C8